jgi:LysM repeat protein
MKKVVPFKKDIVFDNNIGEINSISLEHYIDTKEENSIKGHFIVSGDYRIVQTSISLDSFEYNLPFEINVSNKYDMKEVEVDIDNFYYEVTNNKILSVNIELAVDNLKEKILEIEEEVNEIEEQKESIIDEINEDERETALEDNEIINEKQKDDTEKTNILETKGFETYKTYKVYLVRENDTLESILEANEVTKETLEMYNDLSAIKLGDKLIIPSA